MKIPERIKHIEVFYDGRCGMCCAFHEWIHRKDKAVREKLHRMETPACQTGFCPTK